nr:H/ACA ribonucleoprotein complex non-core subunit NAF1-like isoform X1 [Onthophagus taurus]
MGDSADEVTKKIEQTSLVEESDSEGNVKELNPPVKKESKADDSAVDLKCDKSSTEDSDGNSTEVESSDDTLTETSTFSANCKDNNVDTANENSTSNGCVKEKNEKSDVIRGNSSLCNLLVYGTDESSESESSSDSESYESLGLSDNCSDDECAAKSVEFVEKTTVRETVRTLGELSIDDLPPVPDLSHTDINVPEGECVHMGNVAAIIDRLVTVDSLPNMPAYDLDTLLFVENGKKPLGYVYDVMGPVTHPVYVIRFNNREEIDSLDVKKGLPVYSAPKTQHTQYVFLDKLMQTKGSDASWTGDNEVPVELAEFSDDEEERKFRRGKGGDTRKRNSIERHKEFEKDMNVKNIIDSRLHRIRDSFEPTSKRHAPSATVTNKPGFHFRPGTTTAPPVFSFAHPPPVGPNVPSFGPFVASPFVQLPQYPVGAPYVTAPVLRGMPPMQNVAPFVPSVPPPPLPHTMASPIRPPTMPPVMAPPPTLEQQKHRGLAPRVLFPTEMGLPRPRGTFVPFYNPGVANVWSYQHSMPPPSHQVRPPRGYYPRNSWT